MKLFENYNHCQTYIHSKGLLGLLFVCAYSKPTSNRIYIRENKHRILVNATVQRLTI